MWTKHPDGDVTQALIRLNDALCTYERATGRQSVLIIREEGGWSHRSMSGKPDGPSKLVLAGYSARPDGTFAKSIDFDGRNRATEVIVRSATGRLICVERSNRAARMRKER